LLPPKRLPGIGRLIPRCPRIAALGGDAQRGLAVTEAARRLEQYGPNLLQQGSQRGPWHILIDQFADFMILVLIAAVVLSGVVGDMADTLAIIAILLLNAVIGFTQEYRAEKAMAALQRIAAPTATVIRDGDRNVDCRQRTGAGRYGAAGGGQLGAR